MLEKMSDFFENRIDTYDSHMLTEIEKAEEFYPLTAEHEMNALKNAGFSSVEVLDRWENTYTLKAVK
ncbi:MAG: hypothetical protein IJ262_01490 [Clostridia bacterium]|nr:hypothetical protein [Clostridia bacterium]